MKYAKVAVESATFSFDKEFDYSKNSIDDLEEILDYYSKDMAESYKGKKLYLFELAVYGYLFILKVYQCLHHDST